MNNYKARLENRKEQENGSISYDLIITKKDTGEEVVNTDYTVMPRQEELPDEQFQKMIKKTAKKRINMLEGDSGKDRSGEELQL
jgi:hypothetical protein